MIDADFCQQSNHRRQDQRKIVGRMEFSDHDSWLLAACTPMTASTVDSTWTQILQPSWGKTYSTNFWRENSTHTIFGQCVSEKTLSSGKNQCTCMTLWMVNSAQSIQGMWNQSTNLTELRTFCHATLADHMYAMHESMASILSEQGFFAHVLDCKVCFNDQGAANF